MPKSFSVNVSYAWIGIAFLLQCIHHPGQVQWGVSAQSVKAEKTCYTPDEDIRITYVNRAQPRATDWVGIFPSSQSNQFSSELDWLWTCGSQTCTSARRRGSVKFTTNIPIGTYKAILSRSQAEPYSAYAVGGTFSVKQSCSSPGPSPTPPAPTGNANEVAAKHLKDARDEIEGIVRDNPSVAATFLRMVFHDCVGGCDGCIDMDNPDNFGLRGVMDTLSGVVSRHAIDGVTRTDIWMLAGVAGAAAVQKPNDRIDFPFTSYGRSTCDGDMAKGPDRVLPGINLNTADIYHFFSNEFGFNERETVAIMGAHTIGKLKPENSGIDGPNGWALSKEVLDNEFYSELIGGGPGASLETMINDAPEWVRARKGDKRLWTGRPKGVEIIMLNADISLVRRLDDSNYDKSIGRATCTFEDSTSTDEVPVCPGVAGAIGVASEFKNDNRKWLTEFRSVLERMTLKGYNRPSCSDSVCKVNRA